MYVSTVVLPSFQLTTATPLEVLLEQLPVSEAGTGVEMVPPVGVLPGPLDALPEWQFVSVPENV